MEETHGITPRRTAVVAGASGGLGGALVHALAARSDIERVFALSRRPLALEHDKVQALALPDYEPAALAWAADALRAEAPRVHLLIVALGLLHDPAADPPVSPEKSLSQLAGDGFSRVMAANALTPLRVLAAFSPMLRHRDGSVTAALSAMVGSIGDNRVGGWYSYRMSKAALNMGLRTAAIELGRLCPRGSPRPVIVALHPGTTVTALSQRFLGSRPARPPADSAARVLEVMDALTAEDSGGFFNWDGRRLPW